MGLPTRALLVSFLAALTLDTSASARAAYLRKELYQGEDFFNGWTFFTGQDPTSGNVNYLSQQDARDQGLAYAQGNTFVMAVDSTSNVPVNGKRNSVRIFSNNNYNSGLFILDAQAMPIGCGTWPSFWTNGPNWPTGGEIDIVEGINNQPNNQMTLHSGTSNQCTLQTTNKQFTGQVLSSNCYSTPTSDSGCSIKDTGSNSFGPGFNNVGGGVFAFLWDPNSGISMWHFPRNNIPGGINANAQWLDPTTWGKPAGFWGTDTCDISDNFYNHVMIFDTTVCGSWAGPAYDKSGCPGTCAQMVANAGNFANAKWIINYVAVYQPA